VNELLGRWTGKQEIREIREMEKLVSRIGLVIPTLGTRPAWLRGTLESIVNQDGVDVDLIVVTPHPERVQSLAAAYGARILDSQTPGISAAVNEGWHELRDSEYLAWLGDDDLLAPYSLGRSVRALEDHPLCSATYGRVRYIDAESETLFVTRPGRIASAYLPWGKDLVPQPGSVFRRSAVEQVGGLDPTLRYAMDYDLFLKLRKVGRLEYVPSEVAAFRLHDGSITGSNRSRVEADEVRARAHSPQMNRRRLVFDPVWSFLDRALYKLLQRSKGVVPTVDGREYVCDLTDSFHDGTGPAS